MILDEIVAHKRHEVAQAQREVPLATLKEEARDLPAPRGFREALAESPGVALIAEIKKASPSAGLIRREFDPVTIARVYERSGASAISVVTDQRFFQGSLTAMRDVGKAVKLPVLRKDFVIDPYQIYEARVYGADAVLLIVAILSDDGLRRSLALCHDLGLDALVEVHTEGERDKAVAAGSEIIGINNRDLRTFSVDLSTSIRLAAGIPEGTILVSESGVRNHDHMRRLGHAGVHGVLVGTALMETEDIGAKVEDLLRPL